MVVLLVQGGAVVTRRLDLLVGSASRGDVQASCSQDAVHCSILWTSPLLRITFYFQQCT